MSAESPAKISLELRVSPLLAGVLVAIHGGAFVVASLLPLPVPLRLLLAALVAISGYRTLMQHALRYARDAVVAVELHDEEGVCTLRRRCAAAGEDARLVDRWVHPMLTLLVVRSEGRRLPTIIVIPADAVAAEGFRRLRVRLRLRPAAA